MGVFDKIEKKLESAVDSVFARAFKGDVQPVEITARLQKELDAEAKLLSRDRKLVPNDFTVWLSKHDYERLVPYSKTLNAEIISQLRDHANASGYVFNGPVSIVYELDETLPTGRFKVESSAVAGVASSALAEETAGTRATLMLEVNGIRHPLLPPGFVIGRGADADLRINDPGMSRKQARIDVSSTNGGYAASITDLGSTNGTRVNGSRITTATLTEGTYIDMGNTRLTVVSQVNNV